METKKLNREWVKNAAIIFLAVLLVLTFFSNTILNRSLPEAASKQVVSGPIVAKVRGSGTVEANGAHEVKMTQTKEIRSVMVKVGDEVKTGDVLFVLGAGDSEELEAAKEALRDLQYSYQRAAIGMPNFDYTSLNRAEKNAYDAWQQAIKDREKADELLKNMRTALADNPEIKKTLQNLEKAKSELDTASADYISAQSVYQQYYDELLKVEADWQAQVNYLMTITTPTITPSDENNTGGGNTGEGNTGGGNTGGGNTGGGNTGGGNTGGGNTGGGNIGGGNTGEGNTGDGNTGEGNTGDGNTGDGNTGGGNTGGGNTGEGNTGEGNTEEGNTGGGNTGGGNTGEGNTGEGNTGGGDTGGGNTGDGNNGSGIDATADSTEPTIQPAQLKIHRRTVSLIKLSSVEIPKMTETMPENPTTVNDLEIAKKWLKVAEENVTYFESTNQNTLATKKATFEAAEKKYKSLQQFIESEYVELVPYQEAYEKAVKAEAEAEAAHYDAESALYFSYTSNEKTLALSNLELQQISEKIKLQQEKVKLLSGETEDQILSNVNGIIQSIEVTAGNTVAADTLICTIEVPDMGHSISFSVTNDQARRLRTGDTATVSNFYWGNEIIATLTNIRTDPKNPQNNKVLTFELEGDVQSGSELTLSVGSKSANYDLVVPNSAIKSDSNGSFVLAIEAKNSALGSRYIAKRVSVEVLASDDNNSAVVAELSQGDFVITTSSAPIKSGDQVRLAEG